MATNDKATDTDLVDLAAAIVSAFVSNNSVRPSELPNLIAEVHRALINTQAGTIEREPELLNPAVNPKRSVHPEYIVCLEDGMKFKSLKRHLRTHHEMSPEEYRQKWGLSAVIRWSHPITLLPVRLSLRKWASANSAVAKSPSPLALLSGDGGRLYGHGHRRSSKLEVAYAASSCCGAAASTAGSTAPTMKLKQSDIA